jgi:hypothetical protein
MRVAAVLLPHRRTLLRFRPRPWDALRETCCAPRVVASTSAVQMSIVNYGSYGRGKVEEESGESAHRGSWIMRALEPAMVTEWFLVICL